MLAIHRWQPQGYLQLPPIGADATVRAEPLDAVERRTACSFDDVTDDE